MSIPNASRIAQTSESADSHDMSDEAKRWQELKRAFDQSVEEGTDGTLESAVDEAMQADIRRLLEIHRANDLALDRSPAVISLSDALQSRALTAGQVLAGRFRVNRFIGEGGIGEVYEAEDLELGQRLAIKTLHPLHAADHSTRERFKREIQLARRISHPNVCRIYDFYPADPAFITMELLEGEVLAARLKREGPLSEAALLPILRQLCDGLDEAHRQGIVHRDLKPTNIMLCGDRVAIMDFGLASCEGHQDGAGSTSTASSFGTPAYMSPEQLEGARVTAASDVYSLGVMLYEMLTGSAPHAGLSPLVIAARRVQEPPPSPRAALPTVSERWDELVRHCLEVRPRDRFRSVTEVLHAADSDARSHFRLRVPKPILFAASASASVLLFTIVLVLAWTGALAKGPNQEALRWFRLGEQALAVNSSYSAARLFEKAVQLDPRFALAHIRLAEAYIQQDRNERAKDELMEADSLRSLMTPRLDRLAGEAAKAAALRDFKTAALKYQALAQIADRDSRPAALLAVSDAWQRAGDNPAALKATSEAANLDPQLAAAWLRKGVLEASLTQLDAARESFRRAEEIFDLRGDLEGLVELFRARAAALSSSRQLDQARNDLARALTLATTLGSPSVRARVLFSLSRLHQEQGQGDLAIERAQQACKIAEESQLEELSVQGTLDLANAWSTAYRMNEIERLLEAAVKQAESIRAPFLLAKARFALAQTMSRLPREVDAITRLLDSAAGYYREHGMNGELNAVVSWGALIDTAAGRYTESRRRSEEARAFFEAAGDRFHACVSAENIAEVEDHTGAFEAAIARYRRLATEYEELGRHQRAIYAYANGAMSALRFGDLKDAREMIVQAQLLLARLGQPAASSSVFLRIVEAELALTENRYRDAETLSRDVLAKNSGGAQGRNILAKGILARSLAATGRVAAGLRIAALNVADARESKHQFLIGEASLRQLEAMLHAKQFKRARELAAHQIEWTLKSGHIAEHAEIALLLSALRHSRSPEFSEQRKLWGDAALRRFLARPDIVLLTKGRMLE